MHATLVRVFNRGALLTGPAGCGKSECALELISRGHTLVADDAVNLKNSAGRVLGFAPENLFGKLAIRDLGILNVDELFAHDAVLRECPIDCVVQFQPIKHDDFLESKLEMERQVMTLLGVEIPAVMLNVWPGRNMALLVEVVAKHQITLQTPPPHDLLG